MSSLIPSSASLAASSRWTSDSGANHWAGCSSNSPAACISPRSKCRRHRSRAIHARTPAETRSSGTDNDGGSAGGFGWHIATSATRHWYAAAESASPTVSTTPGATAPISPQAPSRSNPRTSSRARSRRTRSAASGTSPRSCSSHRPTSPPRPILTIASTWALAYRHAACRAGAMRNAASASVSFPRRNRAVPRTQGASRASAGLHATAWILSASARNCSRKGPFCPAEPGANIAWLTRAMGR